MEHVREADEEVVRKAHKVLTPYMNFYLTQCKGVKLEGGKTKMNNNVCEKKKIRLFVEQKQAEAEWIAKYEVEEVLKKEEVRSKKAKRKCNMKKLSNIFKEMRKVKIYTAVKELGFSPLIGMRQLSIHCDLCRELVDKFDVESSMMEFSGHQIPIMVEDVEAVPGLKNEGQDVEEATRKFDWRELAEKHKN
ncbi:hypothetical protein GQ457_03G020800 [Hibiscus cannabinus]